MCHAYPLPTLQSWWHLPSTPLLQPLRPQYYTTVWWQAVTPTSGVWI